MQDIKNKIWFEKYRPTTLDEMILPDSIRDELQGYIEKNDIPNLMFYSPGGMGKTTAAKVLVEALGMDTLEINGSLDTSVEVVRDKIMKFASTVSLMNSSQNKCIFVTEADGFSNEAKNSLKNLIEKFESNVRIIFDTNHIEKMPQPLRSRCVEIDFNYDKKDYPQMMKSLLKRCIDILKENEVTFDKKDVANLIKTRFPDLRKVMNDLQKSSVSGEFVPSNDSPEEQFTNIVSALVKKDYDEIRSITKDVTDCDNIILRMYKMSETIVDRKSLPQFILILGDYQHRSMNCLSKEINFLAMCTEFFSKKIEFK